jgi:hypothetical protein
VPKCNTSKIREGDVTSALGGHLLVGQHKNQPKVGICGRRDIGEGARPGRNAWGGRHAIVWGGILSNKKIKIKGKLSDNSQFITLQIDGQSPNLFSSNYITKAKKGHSITSPKQIMIQTHHR